MKVLFATYPMAFHTPGGGEIQLLAYKKALENLGIEVDLFNPWEPNFKSYDLVHYFSCVGGSIHLCNFIKQLNIPLVVSSSLWLTDSTLELYPIGEIKSQFEVADKVVANSNIECDELSRILGINRERFGTVYNGIDDIFLERVSGSDFRGMYGIFDKFLLNVANIEKRKNQVLLAQAMKSFPEYKLVLIGHIRDSDYFKEIESILGEQLIYVGALQHESPLLRSAYSAATAFVLPSTLETPGLAALEASAQGVSLLVTQEGSTQEYFGTSAEYVSPHDLESIKSGINVAIENKGVESSVVTRYTWQNAAIQLMEIYESVLN